MSNFGYTQAIRRYVNAIPAGLIFSTREVLNSAPRASVDVALSKMVASGQILRLARGVFVKPVFGKSLPSLREIASFKAGLFCRSYKQLPKLPEPKDYWQYLEDYTRFATDSASSSFLTNSGRSRIVGRSPRKLQLGDSPAGLAVRALWELGRGAVSKKEIAAATERLGREDRKRLSCACDIMPAWLADKVVWRK